MVNFHFEAVGVASLSLQEPINGGQRSLVAYRVAIDGSVWYVGWVQLVYGVVGQMNVHIVLVELRGGFIWRGSETG